MEEVTWPDSQREGEGRDSQAMEWGGEYEWCHIASFEGAPHPRILGPPSRLPHPILPLCNAAILEIKILNTMGPWGHSENTQAMESSNF